MIIAKSTPLWLFTLAVPAGESPKFHCYWKGPYTVVRRIHAVDYSIYHDDPSKTVVVHHDRLKPCLLPDIPHLQPPAPAPATVHQPTAPAPGSLVHSAWPFDDDDPDLQLPPPLQPVVLHPAPPPTHHHPVRVRHPPAWHADYDMST